MFHIRRDRITETFTKRWSELAIVEKVFWDAVITRIEDNKRRQSTGVRTPWIWSDESISIYLSLISDFSIYNNSCSEFLLNEIGWIY